MRRVIFDVVEKFRKQAIRKKIKIPVVPEEDQEMEDVNDDPKPRGDWYSNKSISAHFSHV